MCGSQFPGLMFLGPGSERCFVGGKHRNAPAERPSRECHAMLTVLRGVMEREVGFYK